jgi:hypothetical protein
VVHDEPEHGDANPDHAGRQMHTVMFANVAGRAEVTALKRGPRAAAA